MPLECACMLVGLRLWRTVDTIAAGDGVQGGVAPPPLWPGQYTPFLADGASTGRKHTFRGNARGSLARSTALSTRGRAGIGLILSAPVVVTHRFTPKSYEDKAQARAVSGTLLDALLEH